MANAKIILFKSKKLKDDKHPVVLRITNKHERKYYTIGDAANYATVPGMWDDDKYYKEPFKDRKSKNRILQQELAKANTIITRFEFDEIEFTFSRFEKEFLKKTKRINVFDFFDQFMQNLYDTGRIGYYSIFKSTKSAIFRFNDKNLEFIDVDRNFLSNLELQLRKTGVKPNAIHVYMRTFRTLFNEAIKAGIAKNDDYPFCSRINPNGYSFESLKEETVKRAISGENMKSIINYPCEEGTNIFHAKNYFLFSFYGLGISFHDLANLMWSDLSNNILTYKRQKTGGLIRFELTQEAKEILDYYRRNNNSSYLFPILSGEESPEGAYKKIKNALKTTNKFLNRIASDLNIEAKLSSYVSRHSWATLMFHLGNDESIIKQGMDHKTAEQTSTYLKEFKNDVVDNANAKMIKKIKSLKILKK